MKVKVLFLLPALVYSVGIVYLSLINLADTPVKDLGMSDKLMHAGAYFGMALLWLLFSVFSFQDQNFFKKIVIVSILSTGFGIFVEVLQDVLTEYRQLDFLDMIANTAGVTVAATVVWLIKDLLTRLKAEINSFFIKK